MRLFVALRRLLVIKADRFVSAISWRGSVRLLCSLALVHSAAHATSFEFSFWPKPGAEKDPRFVQMHDGACGAIAIARVKTMPQQEKTEVFEPEVVYQLDAQSRQLRQWTVPANTLPVAVSGDRLIFSEFGNRFSVNQKGDIRKVSKTLRIPEPTEARCQLPPALKPSDYARCMNFPNLAKKKTVTLVFQGPCT